MRRELHAGHLARRWGHWRWHFAEGGTSTKAARPFLRPALDANAAKVVGELKDELRKAIDRVLKRRAKNAVGARLSRLGKRVKKALR